MILMRLTQNSLEPAGIIPRYMDCHSAQIAAVTKSSVTLLNKQV